MALQTRDTLRKHVSDLLNWKDAHVDFDTAVKGIPARSRGLQPANLPYSLWQIVEHLRIAQFDILDFCINPDYRERKWPEDYWPKTPEPPDPKAWQVGISGFRADRKKLISLLNDPGIELSDAIPHGQGQTYLREFLLAADHAAFHVGQLVIVRRFLGIWPSQ
jgi:hypothetical protein